MSLLQTSSNTVAASIARCNDPNFALNPVYYARSKACLKSNVADSRRLVGVLKPQLEQVDRLIQLDIEASKFRLENCLGTVTHEITAMLKASRVIVRSCARRIDECPVEEKYEDDEGEWYWRYRDENLCDMHRIVGILKPQFEQVDRLIKLDVDASMFRLENCLKTRLSELVAELRSTRASFRACMKQIDECPVEEICDDHNESDWYGIDHGQKGPGSGEKGDRNDSGEDSHEKEMNREDFNHTVKILQPQLEAINNAIKLDVDVSMFRVENCLANFLHDSVAQMKVTRTLIERCAGRVDDCPRKNRDDDENDWYNRYNLKSGFVDESDEATSAENVNVRLYKNDSKQENFEEEVSYEINSEEETINDEQTVQDPNSEIVKEVVV
ncbi:hypothetical protein quinque_005358 [Culex quinquefasciatus]